VDATVVDVEVDDPECGLSLSCSRTTRIVTIATAMTIATKRSRTSRRREVSVGGRSGTQFPSLFATSGDVEVDGAHGDRQRAGFRAGAGSPFDVLLRIVRLELGA
jgi:hypothetical protein